MNKNNIDWDWEKPIGFGYFCNIEELPGVVACCTKINPSLNESCYNKDTLFKLDRIHC